MDRDNSGSNIRISRGGHHQEAMLDNILRDRDYAKELLNGSG